MAALCMSLLTSAMVPLSAAFPWRGMRARVFQWQLRSSEASEGFHIREGDRDGRYWEVEATSIGAEVLGSSGIYFADGPAPARVHEYLGWPFAILDRITISHLCSWGTLDGKLITLPSRDSEVVTIRVLPSGIITNWAITTVSLEAAYATVLLLLGWRAGRRRRRHECTSCGYDIRLLKSHMCPECGGRQSV